MEYINRIELQGEIGAIIVQEVNGLYVANFSLATVFMSKVGASDVCETTWHNVVAWETAITQDPYLLKKGDVVNVVGRLRQSTYIGAEGYEKSYYEVVASRVTIVKE